MRAKRAELPRRPNAVRGIREPLHLGVSDQSGKGAKVAPAPEFHEQSLLDGRALR
jgi:hypothetical protein